jgi:hypothetical protein
MSSLPPLPENNNAYGATPAPIEPGAVPNHLAWAIISAVVSFCLCCVIGGIPGIVAIVFSSKVNGALARGDLAGAQRASATAKTWCWIATGLAIFGVLLNIWSYSTGGPEHYRQMLEELQRMQNR